MLDPLVLQANGTFGNPQTEFWEVADIVWQGDTCQVRELGAPGCRAICTRAEAEAGGCPPGLERGRPCP